jgi:hypothetical protein
MISNTQDSWFIKLKNLKLGFELWEILTAFTLALTVASMLLWFSSLQPGHTQDEFIWQDQAKNQLHNISMQVTDINGSELRAFSLLPSDTVCNDDLKLTTELDKKIYQTQKVKLNKLNLEIEDIKNQAQSKNIYVDSVPKLSEVAGGFSVQVKEADNFLEKKLYLSGQILELRTTRDNWCVDDDLKVGKQDLELFTNFNSELAKLDTKKSKNLLESTTDTKNILEKITDDNTLFTPEIKAKLIENYKYLWSFQSIQELTEFNKIQNNQNNGRLADYEVWQKKYLESNPKLRTKVVFIGGGQ